MDETTLYKLPFPEDSDAPNGPAQIGALAEAVDATKWASRSLKPTTVAKAASEELALSATYQDVPGATWSFTPAINGLVVVTAHFDLVAAGNAGACSYAGTIRVDSTDQTPIAFYETSAATAFEVMISQSYVVEVAGGEEHTIKLRARRVSGFAGYIKPTNTRMIAQLWAA